MTRKVAIFVEGQTEQIFVKRLLEEIAGRSSISFEEKILPDNKGVLLLQKMPKKSVNRYFALIVNCCNDEKVKSAILDNRISLIKHGYSLIIGLRDLYPYRIQDKAKVERGLAYGVPTKEITIAFLLAVMEIESWFLQEVNHFARISSMLTSSYLKSNFHFNPSVENAENINAPANFLHTIYKAAGKAYRKKKNQVNRTVGVLDYENIYLNCSQLNRSLNTFIETIDNFIQ